MKAYEYQGQKVYVFRADQVGKETIVSFSVMLDDGTFGRGQTITTNCFDEHFIPLNEIKINWGTGRKKMKKTFTETQLKNISEKLIEHGIKVKNVYSHIFNRDGKVGCWVCKECGGINFCYCLKK